MKKEPCGRTLGKAVGLTAALLASNLAWGALYSVTDLGPLTDPPGRGDAKPYAINNGGQVVEVNGVGNGYAALLYGGAWTNLGTLAGNQSWGFGLNASGCVVGRSLTASGFTNAFLWTPGGTNGVADNPQMENLGTLGGSSSEADSINTSGQVTGSVLIGARSHAFLYSGGTMTDIGLLLTNLPDSYGYGINDAGHIAGQAFDNQTSHVFFYDGSTAVDIGTLGGSSAFAMAINNSDQIAGCFNSNDFYYHAFRYSGGVMTDLGTLGGDSYGLGINNGGVIVGGAFTDPADMTYHAFIAPGSSLIDLNTQLDASGDGWTLTEARAINDLGQIVGVGNFEGVDHSFLLTPQPNPADTTAPVISGCTNLVRYVPPGASGAVVNWTNLTALDDYDGPVTVFSSPANGATFPLGVTTVACWASDFSHNTNTCAFTVSVLPVPAPRITRFQLLGPEAVLSFTTLAQGAYFVQAKADAAEAWNDVLGNLVGTGGILTVTNPVTNPGSSQFYRVYLKVSP